MYTVTCLNPIAKCGLERLPEGYQIVEDLGEAQAVLVRSASMHELELPGGLLAVARAGADALVAGTSVFRAADPQAEAAYYHGL